MNELVTGSHSLASLAASNPDGWALAYYSPVLASLGLTRPQIIRAGPPANNEYDTRFSEAVSEMLALDPFCAVTHIRAASSGHTNAPDPHPFQREDMILAHNGTIDRITLEALLTADDPKYLDEHPPDYTSPYVDSELYFLYLRKLREQGVEAADGTRRFGMADVISAAVLQFYESGAIRTAANCLVSEGDTLFALRFDPEDTEHYRLRYRKIPAAWVVASEPVGGDTTGWSAIPPKSLGIFLPEGDPQFVTIFPPPGPWISVKETRIDDDLSGQSSGNHDKDIDAGETVELRMQLENQGADPAYLVRAELTTADTMVTILDGYTTYPDIPAGGLALPTAPFVVAARPICQYYHTVNFSLEVTTGTGPDTHVWQHTVMLPIFAPIFSYYSSIVTDGNDNVLQPGEEGDVELWLYNNGSADASSLSADLTSQNPFIHVLSGHAGLDSLKMGESDSLAPPFRISVAPDCPAPDFVPMSALLSADWGLSARIDFEVPVGGFVDLFEGGQGEWTHTSGMTGYKDAWHLSQQRNHTPGGSQSWKCGGPEAAPYPDFLDAMLISPVIPLTEDSELHFWHWVQAQLGGHFGEAYDGGIVEASINGAPWQQLYPAGGYGYLIASGSAPGPFPDQTPVFSGYCPWREEIIPISGHTGTIQFRFRFGSDGSYGLEGWYIDDVRFIGRQASSGADEEPLTLQPALAIGGPSPFREQTMILYDVAQPGIVDLSILDLEGRVLRHLDHGFREVGRHKIVWDGRDGDGRAVPSGLYFYRLHSEGDRFEEIQRVICLR